MKSRVEGCGWCKGCGDGDYDEVIGVRQGIEQVDANWADQNQKQPPITLMILLTTLTIILDTIIGVTHRLENDNDNYDDYFGVVSPIPKGLYHKN